MMENIDQKYADPELYLYAYARIGFDRTIPMGEYTIEEIETIKRFLGHLQAEQELANIIALEWVRITVDRP